MTSSEMSCLPLSKLFHSLSGRLLPDNMADESSPTTIYFGYGSNLWRQQMLQRCPKSKYLGIARLKGYRWIIYERGYANIVEIDEEDNEEAEKHKYKNEVWGLVYSLEPSDERRLDGNEGVPVAYTKEDIEIEFWTKSAREKTPIDIGKEGKKMDMLVYINRKLDEPSNPKTEYIHRMNMGIRDAVHEGVPQEYVDQVLRKYIPDNDDNDDEDDKKMV
nr:gamma-glutamylcyclotransferase [Quercus suber]